MRTSELESEGPGEKPSGRLTSCFYSQRALGPKDTRRLPATGLKGKGLRDIHGGQGWISKKRGGEEEGKVGKCEVQRDEGRKKEDSLEETKGRRGPEQAGRESQQGVGNRTQDTGVYF